MPLAAEVAAGSCSMHSVSGPWTAALLSRVAVEAPTKVLHTSHAIAVGFRTLVTTALWPHKEQG